MPAARALPLALLLVAGTATAEPRADEVFSISPAVDGAIIAASALATFVPTALEDRILRLRCPCERSEVPGFERFVIGRRSEAAETASDVTLWLSLAAPPLLNLLDVGAGRAWLHDATVYGQALAVSSALVTLVKFTAQRPIPRAYAGDPDALRDPDGYRAFFSGHTTLTFTALTAAAWTLRFRHGEQVWPWFVAGALGTSVAAERVLAARHFPTDVVAGGLVGVAVGTVVPFLHRRSPAAGPARPGVSVLPSHRGVLLSGTF